MTTQHYTLYDVHYYIVLLQQKIGIVKQALQQSTSPIVIEDTHRAIPDPIETITTLLAIEQYVISLRKSIDSIINDYATTTPGQYYGQQLSNFNGYVDQVATLHHISYPIEPLPPIRFTIEDIYYSQFPDIPVIKPYHKLLFQIRLLFDSFPHTDVPDVIIKNNPAYHVIRELSKYRNGRESLDSTLVTLGKQYQLLITLSHSDNYVDYHIECTITHNVIVIPIFY